MTQTAVNELWNAYLEAYGDVPNDDRRRLLAGSVSDDVVSINPGEETRGLENLIGHIENSQQRLPGAYFKMNSSKLHHERTLAEWTLYKADGSVVATAHTYGVLDDDGHLKELIGFF